MKRFIIVNADDCLLTESVTRAILNCHDRGIVTSTTCMINREAERESIRQLKKRRRLGVGLHLNITLGRPVSNPERVRSLVDAAGDFRKIRTGSNRWRRLPKTLEVAREYDAQIRRFCGLFGRLPTHLDTHHQLHDHPAFLRVLLKTARRWGLPFRRTLTMHQDLRLRGRLRSSDYLFGNLDAARYWRKRTLKKTLLTLPEGTSEIVCHPGYQDRSLAAVSSFVAGRGAERRLLCDPEWPSFLKKHRIGLTHFGLCYTRSKTKGRS